MRAAILTILAAVTLATGISGGPANAFPPAAPSANKPAGIVTQVAAVCGGNGCSTVMTKKVRHYSKLPATGPGQRI